MDPRALFLLSIGKCTEKAENKKILDDALTKCRFSSVCDYCENVPFWKNNSATQFPTESFLNNDYLPSLENTLWKHNIIL